MKLKHIVNQCVCLKKVIYIEKQQTIARKIKARHRVDDFGKYDQQLTKQIRLKTIKRIAVDIRKKNRA